MPTPTDEKLYRRVKEEVVAEHPKNSAYRSGLIVKEYKRRASEKGISPYKGSRSKSPLGRWFKERWRNQRGEVGYSRPGDIYRPTRRVSRDTPKTMRELSKKEISKASREKRHSGRVQRF